MTQSYTIEGMTCQGCVASVKKSLEGLAEVLSADITLSPPEGVLVFEKEVSTDQLQAVLGKYTITKKSSVVAASAPMDNLKEKSLDTYKPLIIIIAYIFGVSLLVQFPFESMDYMLWMRLFMAGFFLVFSFFKLLNISGFASSYSMYDIIAKQWYGWGYIYPFVELGLGILYLINVAPVVTNWLTIFILGVSSIGVIRSVLSKSEIKCACLGDVFNLPMSTVTIIEDLTMVGMAAVMLLM